MLSGFVALIGPPVGIVLIALAIRVIVLLDREWTRGAR